MANIDQAQALLAAEHTEMTKKTLDDRALQHIAIYFRALSEPLRLKILNALRERTYTVGELTDLCQCSQANVSKHLSLLAQAGIVERETRSTSAYYRIVDERIYKICDLVCGQLAESFANKAALHARIIGTPVRKVRAGKKIKQDDI